MLKIEAARIRSDSFRRRTEKVDTLVLHYTAVDLEKSMRALRDGAVSVHYVLAEDGTAFKILENNEVGFHAGLSTWRGKRAVNDRSIGVEIVNLDGNKNEYPPAQIAALIELCKLILAENPGIPARNVVGHSDVSPKRKVDPGTKFPWQQLAEAGIGLWPSAAVPEAVGTPEEIQALLKKIGYHSPHAYGTKNGSFVYVPAPDNPAAGVTRIVRVGTTAILRAFQLRYEPAKSNGRATKTTMGLLRAVAAQA